MGIKVKIVRNYFNINHKIIKRENVQIPEGKQPVFEGLTAPALHHLVPLSSCRDLCFQYKCRYSAHRNHRIAH